MIQLIPNTIKPRFGEYDTPMETGAPGSAIFNRAGRLLGIHQQATLRDPTNNCTVISAIISYVELACLPPVPLLMSTCVGHNSINIYWSMPTGYTIFNSLQFYYILEYCEKKPDVAGLQYIEIFRGTATLFTLEKLTSNTSYTIRCKAVNTLFEGGWSFPLRVKTLPGTFNMILVVLRFH